MPKIMYDDKNYSMGTGTNVEIEVDSELNEFSENPIQNKVVTNALNDKLNVSDISEWAKSETKPEYTAAEVGADEKGSADTALDSAKSYTDDKIADLINGAPNTLDTLKEIATAIEENETIIESLNTAIGSKANSSDLTAHINNKNNPHEVSKTDVGLGNVENKSSATIRGELTKTDITNALGYTPPTTDTKYVLPKATSETLGGVMVGTGFFMVPNSGIINVATANALSTESTLPIQNNVVTKALSNKQNSIESLVDATWKTVNGRFQLSDTIIFSEHVKADTLAGTSTWYHRMYDTSGSSYKDLVLLYDGNTLKGYLGSQNRIYAENYKPYVTGTFSAKSNSTTVFTLTFLPSAVIILGWHSSDETALRFGDGGVLTISAQSNGTAQIGFLAPTFSQSSRIYEYIALR